jgi:copper resistance protein D
MFPLTDIVSRAATNSRCDRSDQEMSAFFPTMRICADALGDVAYAALAGALLNRLWLGRISICDRRLRICLNACSTILMLDLPLQYLLLSASMTGDTSWTDAWGAVPDVAATHAGRATIMGFCFVPCLLLFSLLPSALKRTKSIFIGIALEVGFIACRALHGHAASDGDFTLREGIQFLHLSATAAWGGGIPVAGLITVPHMASLAEEDGMEKFARRLSGTVTIALAVVILTGIYNSWKGLGGSLSPLLTSAWGRMLLLKMSFVLLALGHGVRVRLLLRTGHPWTPNRTVIMRQWIRAEALFMVLVLACSAWLANLPPADM